MAHRCTYEDRLIFDDELNQFYRLVTAKWKDRTLDVIKIYEDGKFYVRNLIYSYLAGYLVEFPGEKARYRYASGSYIVEEEEFEEVHWNCNVYAETRFVDKKYIVLRDPSLKYLITKYKGDRNDELLKIIAMYRKYPEIEPLVEIGQCKLALDNRLHKLTKIKKIEVINFVRENITDGQVFDLSKVFTCIKNNIRYKHYETFIKCKDGCKDDNDLFKYLIKQGQEYSFYEDYKKMAIKAGHNFDDEYWKHPKSLVKAHDKVLEECKNIDDALDLIISNQFEIVAEKLKKQEQVIDGNHYYIVQSYEDFCNQANSLKQCLIIAGYMNKFIKQESVLIFIKNAKNEPLGTVEIDYKKKILQAYGNEYDRSNCRLPSEILEAVNKYIKGIKISKHKFTYKLPQNCFYKGLYDDDKSFNGVEFKEGKIYQTVYDDKTIIKTGSKCLASDKVYHFCKTVDDVKGWVINPYAFAIVEPLGPVVQNGTAFGSNKIKIRKIASQKDIARIMLSVNKSVKEVY